jgi:hypothetical protein
MSSWCIVTTLQAPLHETLMFVNYHLNIGADHIYLFFDDPGDAAAERHWTSSTRGRSARM